jgi:polysaccharide export outer membrane protein
MEAPFARRYIVTMTCVQRLTTVACVAWALAGPVAVSAQAFAPPPVLQVGPGDQIRVEVFGSADLTTTTYVADDGFIRLPLAGAVAVGGQSPAEAAKRIETALKVGQFLVNPQVTVSVVQSLSQRVSVLGEVTSPGRYPIQSNSTVFDLIAQAGGLTAKGSDRIYVLRADESGTLQRLPVDLRRVLGSQDASSAAIKTLRGGDSIIVPKGTFTIAGQVTQPGEYRIEGDMMLFEAIARAGGVTPMGSSSRVEVRRRGANDKVIEVKVNKNLRIEPGDVIRVKERLF